MKTFLFKFIVTASFTTTAFAAQANSNMCESIFSPDSAQVATQIDSYLADTLHSLELMRGDNGLVKDAVWIRAKEDGNHVLQTMNDNTSPTNMGVDLLIQSEMALDPLKRDQSIKNLEKLLTTLEKLDYHKDTGLFYSRYTTAVDSNVTDYAVSSIDNLHLAIALFTTKETLPGTQLALKAKKLFDRMNFSVYLDETKGVIGGNLRYDKENNVWIKEAYNLDDLGSEGRGLYSVGWALGLYHDIKNDAAFPATSLAAVRAEVGPSESGNLLKLWDGSAFQLYFPKMFINEEVYSPMMKGFYKSMADHMIAEGERRGLSTPAAHSAGYVAKKNYRDKSGNISVVSSYNNDVKGDHARKNWESTFTPYALFMAGSSNAGKFIPLISDLHDLPTNKPFYLQGMGWMDGYHVKGSNKGNVTPVQLALNQGMIALSLLQMKDPDGMSLSSRMLYANPVVRQRLQYFYKLFDQKIQSEASAKSGN